MTELELLEKILDQLIVIRSYTGWFLFLFILWFIFGNSPISGSEMKDVLKKFKKPLDEQ